MALSKLENEKATGKLNLDFLKKRNNKNGANMNSPRQGQDTADETVERSNSIIPPASTAATFVIPGSSISPSKGNSNLPPPAVATAVVKI